MTVEDRVSGRPSAENSPALDRTAELGEVLALLADRDVRLVTVVGSPGAGKSWLAARVLAAWTGLTVSASLAHVTDAGLAADEVLASLEIGDGFASTPGHALWLAADGAPALLLLDDADDVADLAPLIEAMLATYPALTVLVTSSRALHVVGERTVVVRPLGDLGSEDPRSNAALALFVQRAAEIDPTFRLDAATTASAAAVCRAVGGLPLAVELAAARIRTVPLAVMAAQLESAAGLALLRRDEALGADSPDRRSSVEAAVDWSMSGLTSAASDLLVQLSVFQGPFDLDAAVAVARPTTPAPELLDRLSELVDAHLVALDPADPESAAFAVAPLVRRRASALLRGASVESEVRDAHAG
jgi:predicted ATPase